jgi:hypothetical protein
MNKTKIIILGLGGIEIGGGVVVEDSNSTSIVGVGALGIPPSCIVGLFDSFGITIFYLSLGTCKLGLRFDKKFFLPWFTYSPMGNSIVLERESFLHHQTPWLFV